MGEIHSFEARLFQIAELKPVGSQFRVSKVHTLKICIFEYRSLEATSVDRTPCHFAVIEYCVQEKGFLENGVGKIRVGESGPGEIGRLQFGPGKIRVGQVAARELRAV